MADEYTISIPKSLADKIEKMIEGTGFQSVSEYVAYVLEELISSMEEESEETFSKEEEEKIKERLRALGYLD